MNLTHYLPYAAGLLLVLFIATFLVVVVIKLKQTTDRQRLSILNARMEEKERVMRTISMELHDQINQKLNLAVMTLKMMNKSHMTNRDELRNQVIYLLDQTISDTHNISHSLNPAYMENRSLFDAIRSEVDLVERSGTLSCSVNEHGERIGHTGETKLMLVRIVQEAIQNTLKHANATKLVVNLDYRGNRLELEVVDDGIGFDQTIGNSNGRIGLESMRKRAEVIGAGLEMDTRPGEGTTVRLVLDA